MGAEVRAVVRQGTSPQTSSAHVAVAPRRNGGSDRRPTILALAGGRRRGRGSRSPCATAARRKGGREAHAQIAQEAGLRAQDACHRQAPLLWSSQDATGLVGSPRARPAEEQPGREFASIGTTTRAEDATFQIARISTTLPVCSRRRPEYVQRSAPSCFPQHPPRPPRRSVAELAGGDRGPNSSRARWLSFGQSEVIVTAPASGLREGQRHAAGGAARSGPRQAKNDS